VVIGWDIGGAHLKAARAASGRVEATAQAATPLWLGLDSLHSAFDRLKQQLGDADAHALTMTGELCDAFPADIIDIGAEIDATGPYARPARRRVAPSGAAALPTA
jgi:uncharacterized hydantoinase/oxoprolinase family protein